MISSRLAVAVTVTLALSTADVSARQQPAPFRSGVEIVYLDLTVTAADGSIVTGLTRDDFEIFDEGVRHEIAVFSDQPAPISLGILVDTSNSMSGDRITAAISAADAMGRALQAKDLWSVFAFNSRLIPLVGWRPYEASVVKELKTIRVGGGTALFKSVADMVPKFRDTSFRKRALLIITDGADNIVQMGRSSRRGLSAVGADPGMPGEMVDHTDKAINALRSGEVLAYGLGIGWAQAGGGNSELHVPSLQKLAEPTGGGVAVARTMADLEVLARRLTDELRQQYTVGFTPLKAPDGKHRRIKDREEPDLHGQDPGRLPGDPEEVRSPHAFANGNRWDDRGPRALPGYPVRGGGHRPLARRQRRRTTGHAGLAAPGSTTAIAGSAPGLAAGPGDQRSRARLPATSRHRA